MTALEHWLLSVHSQPPPWLVDYSNVLAEYRRNPGALTSHGHQDLFQIGTRFASLYAKSLQRVGATVRIRASYKERAVSSAQAFREGYIVECDKFKFSHHITSLTSNPTPMSTPTPTPTLTPTSSANIGASSSSSTVVNHDCTAPADMDTEMKSAPASFSSPSLSASSISSALSESEEASTPTMSSDTELSDDPEPGTDTPPEHQEEHQQNEAASSTFDHLAVQVLPLGRDAILRYFEQNVEYANFTNQHKALTRKDLSRGTLRRYTAGMAARMTEAFGSRTPMDIDLVRSVAEAAAFDTAHGRGNSSIFCKTITPTDVHIINTFERRHRPFFKAHEHFENVSAPLVKDLVESMQASVKQRQVKKKEKAYAADTRFAHAETLVPLLLLLGIRSNGLNPSNPHYRQGLAVMSPFAANLALELYEDEEEDGSVFHFVRFRLNERYVERVPALGEHGLTGVVRLNHLLDFFNAVLAAEDNN